MGTSQQQQQQAWAKFDYENKEFSEQQLLQLINETDIGDSELLATISSDRLNEEWFRITTAFSYGILAFAGLICNCIFCFVIWRSKKLHTVTHMLMTNLALSNILFLLFHPPFFMSTYILQTNWVFGTIMCKASFSIMYVTATGSFYFMSLVAIDRWLAIFRRKSRLSKRKCIWLTAFVWLIALAVASPYLYLSGEVHTMGEIFNLEILGSYQDLLGKDRVQCGIDCPSCKRVLQIVTIIAQYGIPLCVMIPTYGHLALFLWQRPTIGVQSRERLRKAQHRRQRMLLTLLAIVGFLVLCWSPLFSVGVLHAYKLIKNDSLSIYIYTSMVALLGVVLTPCFYLLNDGFRKQIFLIVPCCKSHHNVGLQNNGNNNNTKALDNTSNIENAFKSSQEPNYRGQQNSPLLLSGNSSKATTSMELTGAAAAGKFSGSDIICYSPNIRRQSSSLDLINIPSSKHNTFDAKTKPYARV